MKMSLLLSAIWWITLSSWHYNLDEAKLIAQREHKMILLNFSGSDWCGPCIRMHKEIFDSKSFTGFADTSLVLVEADFPRMKKNQLSTSQQEINNKMADAYNSQGKFPYTLLLDEQGKVVRAWEGFTGGKPEDFIEDIQNRLPSQHLSK
jgi:thioredoxin-related protein